MNLIRRREVGVLALWAVMMAVVSWSNPLFLQVGNLHGILIKCAPAAIVACGVTLVILTGEIDISVGSLMGLLAAVAGVLTSSDHPLGMGLPVATAMAVTLVLGAAIGFLTGVLVTLGRVPSIVVTLGMLTALRGVTQVLLRGGWIDDIPPGLRAWSTDELLGVRVCLWITAAVVVMTMVVARRTPLGRRIYAVGSSVAAARAAGLSVRRIKIFTFTLTGFLTAVATLAGTLVVDTIEPNIGVGFELLVVTCVVVGGASISGGRGTVIGSMLGVLLLQTVGTALIFLRLGRQAAYWERAIQGMFILVAVLADHLGGWRTRQEGPS